MRQVDEVFGQSRLSGAGMGHTPILLPRPDPCLADDGRGQYFLIVFGHDGRELAAVFLGGAIGTLARAALAALTAPDPTRWPWPTFTVNIVGALLLGYFSTRLLERLPQSSYRRPLLGTGVCGGLTTFSTMQVEVLHMLAHQQRLLAVSYTLVSVVLGLLAVHVATVLTRRGFQRAPAG